MLTFQFKPVQTFSCSFASHSQMVVIESLQSMVHIITEYLNSSTEHQEYFVNELAYLVHGRLILL